MKGSILIELDMVFNHVSVTVKQLLESDVFYSTIISFIVPTSCALVVICSLCTSSAVLCLGHLCGLESYTTM